MAKTNKQLINLGLGQEEILEIVEGKLNSMNQEDGTVSSIEWEGDDFTTGLWFADHKGRKWNVYYLDGENTDTLYVNSFKGEEMDEKNVKSFKSITATMNHIKRVIGL